MANGFGRGRGFGGGGGRGFGFRGSSPPWPYVGIGRGGLPRCGYFFGGAGVYQPPAFYPGTGGYAAYNPQMTRETELDYLKSQAESIKSRLEEIESRRRAFETED